MPDSFEIQLSAFAKRAMRIVSHCASEEATRIYLVMPFFELLGYDAGDPSVLVPAHDGTIDFTLLVDGSPEIAIVAIGASEPVAVVHERLRRYWNVRESSRLGIATNGIVIEAFIDSETPHSLDAEPFATIDLEAIAGGVIDRRAIDLLRLMRPSTYDPNALAERAYAAKLHDRLKGQVLQEFRHPSDALCRLLLEQIGIRDVSADVIDQHYRSILKSSMEEAIVVPVVQALRYLPKPARPQTGNAAADGRNTVQAKFSEELAAFGRSKRRSA
jgi:predicted type IV restriction endonuclease